MSSCEYRLAHDKKLKVTWERIDVTLDTEIVKQYVDTVIYELNGTQITKEKFYRILQEHRDTVR